MAAKKAYLEREDFLKLMSTSTPEQLNDIIEQRGKKTKGVPIISFINKKLIEKN